MAAAWAGSVDALWVESALLVAPAAEPDAVGPDDDTCCGLVAVGDPEPEQAPIRARQVMISNGTARARVADMRRVSVIHRRTAFRCPEIVSSAEDLDP
jgi:hypothetical protein